MGPAIGIDLGTTFCCFAVYRNAQVDVLENERGMRQTPSYVGYSLSEKKWFCGNTAQDSLAIKDPKSTVYDAKRMIGRTYCDEAVIGRIKTWPFKVIEKGGEPKVVVPTGEIDTALSPQEVSGKLLAHIKENASMKLGEEVTEAVITVPATFNNNQREATLEAAQKAGLKVLRLVNEPTAAALAYGHNDRTFSGRLLVFDFGGGTLDVTIVDVKDQQYNVVATSGNDQLGGQDIVNNLMSYVVKNIQSKHKVKIENINKRLAKIRQGCEKIKRDLSHQEKVSLIIEYILDGDDLELPLSRLKFEDLNKDIFIKALDSVKEAINIANITKESINRVIMVGGSSRIPKIKILLENFFGSQIPVMNNINTDEAVAQGAAILASMESGAYDNESKNTILVDVIPRSLGVEVHGGLMSVILPRNTTIPHYATKTYETKQDNQKVIELPIYEGEDKKVCNNNHLGDLAVQVPLGPAGFSQVKVTFHFDACGILNVTAEDLSTRKSIRTSINRHLRQTDSNF